MSTCSYLANTVTTSVTIKGTMRAVIQVWNALASLFITYITKYVMKNVIYARALKQTITKMDYNIESDLLPQYCNNTRMSRYTYIKHIINTKPAFFHCQICKWMAGGRG